MMHYRFHCFIGGARYKSGDFKTFKACHEAMCAANKLSYGTALPWVESCKVVAFEVPKKELKATS